ncbi:MAG: transglutaminase domain-containing protein [Chloroflexota bacterium]|nr:transglutaminase domain-containing protein [Dehalococcoidia bacterium]MDW8252667.1 transglutaminase domain-containing protein [Chloroflexota bacterium]
MSTIAARFGADSVGELLLSALRRLWPREGFLTVALLFFTMLSGVWSVEAAGWVDRLPPLGLVLLGATAMGFVFAKTRLQWWLCHPVGLLYGTVVSVWATTSLIPLEELSDRIVDLIIRLNAWGYAARTGGYNTDALVFVFWVCALTWLIGYFSTFVVFRLHRVWLGILPSGVAILFNLRFAPPQATVWFFFYLAFALLLLVRFNVFQQHERWKRARVDFQEGLGLGSLPEMSLYALLISLFVWLMPSGGVAPLISEVWNAITGPYNDFAVEFNRLFANLNTTQEGPSTTFSRALILKGPIKLGSAVIMYVQADQPIYLRATVYDIYNGRGMITGEKQTLNFPPGAEAPPPTKDYRSRKELTQKVTLRATPGNAILAGGIPLRASQRAVAEVDKPLSYFLSLDDTSTDSSLPAQVRSAAPQIREVFLRLRQEGRLGASPADLPAEIARSLPNDLRVANYLLREGRVAGLELQFVSPYPIDFTSVRAPGRGRAPSQYSVVSSVSIASERELRNASTDYPGWITERYLQLPPNVPERVRRLAQELTAGATNPYDKATRIQDYLRSFRYNENIEAPPPSVDPVEHFLFTMREGYCDYFATAMVVMLRSLGIPARISAGYFTGEFDSNRGYYLVREANTHAWPEVFFPDYGWIEFEPTPSRPPIPRGAGTDDGDAMTSGPSTAAMPGDLEDPGFIEDDFGLGLIGGDVEEEGAPILPLLLLTLLALTGAGGWYFWQRGLRGLTSANLVYAKVTRLAAIAYRPQREAETPVEYGRALASLLPGRERAVAQVMDGYTAARYSRTGPTLAETVRLRRAWQELRSALLLLIAKRPFRLLLRRRFFRPPR